MLAVEDKYAQERQAIVAGVRKLMMIYRRRWKHPKPDEAKLKELVSALTADQDKMFASFKNQRDEELALMTPLEQAKYLIILGQWRQKMMKKHGQKPGGRRIKPHKPVIFPKGLPSLRHCRWDCLPGPRAFKTITVHITPG